MKEFIVWDKEEKKFGRLYGFDQFEATYILDEDTEENAMYKSPSSEVEIFPYIGKTDDTPEQNKIYAECSIVEFDNWGATYTGYFTFVKERLSYMIHVPSEKNTWVCSSDFINLKVIGTIQEDKHLLESEG